MKRVLAVVLAVAVSVPARAATFSNEVLVLTSSTRVDTGLTFRRGLEIQNLGPNAIYCSIDVAPVVTKARKLDASGGTWAVDIGTHAKVYCIAATANQVTGAATIVTEVR